jgi:hypothetical protein
MLRGDPADRQARLREAVSRLVAAIFELTVAAALGAGMDQLRAGLSLLGREP